MSAQWPVECLIETIIIIIIIIIVADHLLLRFATSAAVFGFFIRICSPVIRVVKDCMVLAWKDLCAWGAAPRMSFDGRLRTCPRHPLLLKLHAM